ncbi:hypothetical protein [Thiocystis violacea]|uniref:hypothetical protein n=1 Tax=Thiocystis violacea TaxID=13725 RepID=UPI001A931A7C|nr:hypothetical protein [Thiocystis violacea]
MSALFGEVRMARVVLDEVLPRSALTDVGRIQAALDRDWLRLVEPQPTAPSPPDLDEGGTACLRVAQARGEPAAMPMDEWGGRWPMHWIFGSLERRL